MHDATISALHAALRGLSARQRVIADNVANLETPQYLAGRVDFETSLQRALERGTEPLAATENVFSRSLAPTGVNGNNVNLEQETLDGIQANLRYELVSGAVTDKFGLLRTAIRGS